MSGGALGWRKQNINSAKLPMILSSPLAGSESPLLYLASKSFDNISRSSVDVDSK